MLTRAIAIAAAAVLWPLLLIAPAAVATDGHGCPPGTDPVSVGSGVICVVVTDPGNPGDPGDPGSPGGGGGASVGCYKTDGTEVPCQTPDGYWWSAYQCYAAPYDAPPGSPAWQGHTDGSLWQCTSCEGSGCHVRIIWTAPGDEPGPPTPAQLATVALGRLPLKTADVHTAPAPPLPTYVGVENWLWIPDDQWTSLSKSVTAGSTTVTATAAPQAVQWTLGTTSLTCHDAGRAWVAGMTDQATTTCSHTYEVPSASEPNGVFTLGATIQYRVTWTCSGACSTASGDLGTVDAPAGTGTIRVLQRQTVVVQ